MNRFLYEKVLFRQAFSRPCQAIPPLPLSLQGPNVEGCRPAGSAPTLKTDPTSHTWHLLWSSTCYVPARVDSTRIHPKMGSTLKSYGRVKAAGKPSDEPLRKGETQSPSPPVQFSPEANIMQSQKVQAISTYSCSQKPCPPRRFVPNLRIIFIFINFNLQGSCAIGTSLSPESTLTRPETMCIARSLNIFLGIYTYIYRGSEVFQCFFN